jgi:hypothetical protein
VTVQMGQNSLTSPGGTVRYSIWVWSTVKARGVKASMSSSTQPTRQPRFTLCPSAHATRCSIGTLPANQALELKVADKVRPRATPGVPITFSITVSATGLSPSGASLTTSVGSVSSTPPPPTSNPIPTLPTTLVPVPGTTITPPNLTGLFPTVTPKASSSTSSSSPGTGANGRRSIRATQVSSALPLDPRLIGGQLAGLAILAAAITMVVARLSLRTPQSASAGTGEPGKDGAVTDAKTEPEPPAS